MRALASVRGQLGATGADSVKHLAGCFISPNGLPELVLHSQLACNRDSLAAIAAASNNTNLTTSAVAPSTTQGNSPVGVSPAQPLSTSPATIGLASLPQDVSVATEAYPAPPPPNMAITNNAGSVAQCCQDLLVFDGSGASIYSHLVSHLASASDRGDGPDGIIHHPWATAVPARASYKR